MLLLKETNIYFAMELSLREISFVVHVHALMTQKSCAVAWIMAVGMRNAILRNHLKQRRGRRQVKFSIVQICSVRH